MAESKHFDKIAWAVTAVTLVLTILFMNGGALGLAAMERTMGYENRLFDNTKVHSIDIVMDDWDTLIENAASEEYYAASVVIDGESYKNVGIRAKGNTSLSTVASLGSERYSFKIEFDHYDKTESYHGLDKLSLNNLIQDSTMMKDYLTYTMMQAFGVDSSLCSFVYITVNGEDWGLYLAVEGVEESFLTRNYGSDYGELYKPDSMRFGGGRGNGKDFDMDDFMNRGKSSADGTRDETMSGHGSFTPPDSDTSDDGTFTLPDKPDGTMPEGANATPPSKPGGDTSDGGSFTPPSMPDGDLSDSGSFTPPQFSDDEDFADFGKGFGGGLSNGSSDVKLQYIDDDLDSYTNIWDNAKTDITEADQTRLVESLRKLSAGEDIASVVDVEEVIRYFVVHNYVCNGDSYTGSMIHNYYLYEKDGKLSMIPWDYNLTFGTFQGNDAQSTVNTPIDAPISGGTNDDRPMWNWILSDEQYTTLYHEYFAEFLETVDIQSLIDDAYDLIVPYVAKDTTAFYSYEEFETGVETLRQFCTLRSESIAAQLANGETTEEMDYADASAISLSAMGTMNAGGGNMPGNGGSFDGQMPDDFDPSQMRDNGNMPDGFDPSQTPGSSDDSASKPSDTDETTTTDAEPSENTRGNMSPPMNERNSDANRADSGTSAALLWIACSVLALAVGLVIVKVYRR